jgi:hypothetical protein
VSVSVEIFNYGCLVTAAFGQTRHNINKHYYVLPGSYSAPSPSSTLWRVQTAPSVSATFEMNPGSVSMLECLVPSTLPVEFPQLYQIDAP